MDPLHPDYVPSIFTTHQVSQIQQKQKLKRYNRAKNRGSRVPEPVSSVGDLTTSSDEFQSEESIKTDSKFSQTTENLKTIDDYKAENALLKAEIAILKKQCIWK